MIKCSIFGLDYIRFILDVPTPDEVPLLTKRYASIKIISERELDLPGFQLTKKQTSMVDLTGELDAVFARFNSTTRNEIKKTERCPELKFCGPDDNRKASYRLYKEIKLSDGAPADLEREFDQCVFFNAYLNERMIVSVSCWDNGDTLRLKSIVSVRKEQNVETKLIGWATRRVIWEICQYGKKMGRRRLDLGGINFIESEKSGITQFKLCFRGDITDIYIYEYTSRMFHFVRSAVGLFKRQIP